MDLITSTKDHLTQHPRAAGVVFCIVWLFAYLWNLNRLLRGVPEPIDKLKQKTWSKEQVKEQYRTLEKQPKDVASYTDQLPPKLDRRYVVTGGSGGSSCSQRFASSGKQADQTALS